MVNKGISKSGVLLIIIGILWILSNVSILHLEEWGWLLKYWPVLLVVAGIYLAIEGRKAKSFSVLLLLIAFFAATLHHGMRFYDNNWNDYDYENDWDIFL